MERAERERLRETIKHDVRKLPKWAQVLIENLESDKRHIQKERDIAEQMCSVTCDKSRSWFTIPAPQQFERDDEILHLWVLDRNRPYAVCSLMQGDKLFVGRKKES